MKLFTRHVVPTLALFVALAAQQACQGKEESKPIVDVRFDAPYQQIASSQGDEWAPTWGRDDVLYTGNDDGNNFGGIPGNAIAFGKLEGSDPDKLKGTSINGMQDFRERPSLGPETSRWRTRDSRKLSGVLYRFVPCGLDAKQSPYSCLVTSADDGKTWTKNAPGEAALFRGTKFSAPSFISYSKDYESIIGKADEYIFAAAYAGIVDGEDSYIVGRVPVGKLANKKAADWSFEDRDGSWKANPDTVAPSPNSSGLGPDGANWKTMNTYSLDGVLYMFVTRCHYPWQSGDPSRRHIFRDSSIIKSTDNGKTWTRSADDNYSHPMFPGKRFGAPYFVWYGKDGEASVDNADKYVYAVANNGHFEAGDDYILGRVLRTQLPNLSAADWTFYTKGDGMQDGSWTSKSDDAVPILANSQRCSMTGMTYIAGLRRYVMPMWSYTHVSFATAIDNKDLSTTVAFYEAPRPWGPWTKVKSFNTGRLGWYTPIIGQRFQAKLDDNTVQAFFYATGFLSKPEGGLDSALYKLNYMPITLSTKPLTHKDPAFVGGK